MSELGRDRVSSYLRAELVGPSGGEEEVLGDPPYRRYIMATLYPQETATVEINEQEPEDGDGSVGEDLADDPVTLAHEWMPSSVGMTFYLRDANAVTCTVAAARYDEERDEQRQRRWHRVRLPDETHTLVPPEAGRRGEPVLVFQERAKIETLWRPLGEGQLLTVTLINTQAAPDEGRVNAELTLHQVALACEPLDGSIGEYPRVDALSTDPEDSELRVLYRHSKVFAIGHGCAVDWDPAATTAVTRVSAQFLPCWVVPALTQDVGGGPVLELRRLADMDRSDAELAAELGEFVSGYERWIDELPDENGDIPDRYFPARDRILERLRTAAARMRAGISLLEADSDALRAFRLANLAMLMQMRHGRADYAGTRRARNSESFVAPVYEDDDASWYPFQLAFQLLALPSTAEPDSPERDVVDLLWFPTGGGKTEAYLALAAFQIFYRRLKDPDRGSGTAVITRYTLRLLTSQQFQRAAALICALELIRLGHPAALGKEDISIGLWVGEGAAPNDYAGALELYDVMLEEERPSSRFQLEICPWCGTELVPEHRDEDSSAYGFTATASSFLIFCPTQTCPFHERLPVSVVDQALYEHPPTFLIATVDKFARLAWVERAGAFFGGDNHDPPSLIIQDELHLLSGPLGTTVALYEAAVEGLIRHRGNPPKVIASTATIRRAAEQSASLFGRRVHLFPPSGLVAADSYWARVDEDAPGRLYLGVMSPSHTISFAVVHVAAAMLQAPEEISLLKDERDAYGTLVVYHNSLRELGRTITLARDDIPARLKAIASSEERMRRLNDESVVELTSNVPDEELTGLLSRMAIPSEEPRAIALLATTNMLSVGVDVPRLGTMLINGQPKTTSEYIQASSRVGRGDVPGLVITLFAATKPRDRSHYESFLPYHAALYRHVEPTSVTPFSPPSRSRALHAALVILIRHGVGLAADDQAGAFRRDDAAVQQAAQALLARVATVDPDESAATAAQIERLMDEWEDAAADAAARGQQLYYRFQGRQHSSLLASFGGDESGVWQTLHSMRNVDRQCTIEVLGAN